MRSLSRRSSFIESNDERVRRKVPERPPGADVQRTGFTSLAVQEHVSGQRSLNVLVAGTHPPTRLHPNKVLAGLRNPQNRFSGVVRSENTRENHSVC
jgi:hypothetical protein